MDFVLVKSLFEVVDQKTLFKTKRKDHCMQKR